MVLKERVKNLIASSAQLASTVAQAVEVVIQSLLQCARLDVSAQSANQMTPLEPQIMTLVMLLKVIAPLDTIVRKEIFILNLVLLAHMVEILII